MPVLTSRRNHHTTLDHSIDLPSPTSPTYLNLFDSTPKPSCTPSPSDSHFNHNQQTTSKSFRDHLDLLAASPVSASSPQTADFNSGSPENFMSGGVELENPTIRIHTSTPASLNNYTSIDQPSMLSTSDFSHSQPWNSMYSGGHLGSSGMPTSAAGRTREQPRSSAAPMMRSSTSASHMYSNQPYGAVQSRSPPTSNKGDSSSVAGDDTSRVHSNHLPTPSHTPTQDTFLSFNYDTPAQGMDNALAAHYAMNKAVFDHSSVGEDDVPGFTHSGRHSVSSFGQDSPATPHTAPGDDFDTVKSSNSNDFQRQTVPKFDRTMTEVYADELCNPAMFTSAPQNTPPLKPKTVGISPYRGQLSERLQQAAKARSQSPAASASRGASPFRHNSPYTSAGAALKAQQARMNASQQRDPSNVMTDAFGLHSQMSHGDDGQPKTISPKDAVLDYQEPGEEAKMPLFPEDASQDYNPYGDASQFRADTSSPYPNPPEGYGSPAMSRSLSSNMYAVSGPSPPQSNFGFVPPSVPGGFHGMSYAPSYMTHPRVTSAPDSTPDFPAHLASMESSASDRDSDFNGILRKPGSSMADSGTYTCTYHGCSQRFETPQKLQKHKREGHRQNLPPNVTPGVGSGMSSAQLLARNSQAGPHKCDRINPTTGKPCNTIFSRPYDLTRHEDTIHNGRKQKVRCALCVEEKTFSRNDALTRHMRVVHPEVDFPGKHRRRGASGQN